MRKLEVELNRTALPLTTECILDLKVDLRAIECAVAFIDLVAALAILLVEDGLEGCLCTIPDVDITHEIIWSGGELCTVGDTEGLVDLVCDGDDIRDLILDLGLHHEGMVIILTELLYTEETVHLTGLLLTVQHIVLRVTDRELLIGTKLTLEGEHRVRAVHRLRCHGVNVLTVVNDRTGLDLRYLLLGCLILIILDHVLDIRISCGVAVDTRNDEHVVQIVCPVTGNEPETLVIYERRCDLGVAMAALYLTAVLKQCLVHLPSTWQPVWHTRSGLVEHEELELCTDLLVVTLTRLLDHLYVLLQLILRRECIHIDTLHVVTLLIASPVCCGTAVDLVSRAHQLL